MHGITGPMKILLLVLVAGILQLVIMELAGKSGGILKTVKQGI